MTNPKKEKVAAFYFSNEDKKLDYGDDREIVIGETHEVTCRPETCKQGLHASLRLIDALTYAKSANLYLVEISGDIDKAPDKIAGKRRKYLKYFNAEKVLRQFSKKQALVNIEKIKPYCSDKDHKTIVDYLLNENSSTAAAWSAESAARSAETKAWSATRSAKSAAVTEKAWSAARSAESAAWSATESAESAAKSAESAAWPAESAKSAAWSAAWSAESARSSVWSAVRSAAWSAAKSTGRPAAEIRPIQNQVLTQMIKDATGWKI